MTYNRADSLLKCLQSLQNLELDGDSASLEVWIDRSKENEINVATEQVARNFTWVQGPVHVHIQTVHAGIYGQWIDTWRPRCDSRERAIFLEDDIDLSPYAYRWLKAAIRRYGHMPDIAGYALSEIQHVAAGMKNNPPDLLYLHSRIGTHGFAPTPAHWRKFQDWFHEKSGDTSFRPYVPKDKTFTGWYKMFEKKNKEKGMWSMWLIRYCDDRKLFTLYPNIAAYAKRNNHALDKNSYFAYHRRENGLHFQKGHRSSTGKVISVWRDYFVQFPSKVGRYFYDGKRMDTIEIFQNQ